MRLAISNIAWPSGSDEAVAAILREYGVQGIEIAPTKVWLRPLEAAVSDVVAYRESWERRGFPIVALQALLFGRPDLTLFDGPESRRQTVAYLKGMIGLAATLGTEALVFGSPKNRRVGPRSRKDAEAIALEVFRELGDFATGSRVTFCIEPNPTAYECDFITSAIEGADLVERVGSPGFGLHLDTGAMVLSGDSFDPIFARSSGYWRHFHISEPNLAPIAHDGVPHQAIAASVRKAGYSRWASIEMKEVADGRPWVEALGESLGLVRETYFGLEKP